MKKFSYKTVMQAPRLQKSAWTVVWTALLLIKNSRHSLLMNLQISPAKSSSHNF